MDSEFPRVAVVTNVLPIYREDMYARLIAYYGKRLQVFCQTYIPGMDLYPVHDSFPGNVNIVKFLSLKKEKICFQFLPAFRLFKEFDVYFFYGNPRVVSNVICATIFKLLGKKVVIWGQLHTAGANKRLESVRLKWWNMFDYVFLYTSAEAARYRMSRPACKRVIGMNNGINQRQISLIKDEVYKDQERWTREQGLEGRKILLSCARLESKNRFDLVIEILPELIKRYPNILWCVIGDGDEKQHLMALAEKKQVANNVYWLGSIYNENKLAHWFLAAQLMVHPGSIGLSLMHAMGYGLPVVTHDNLDRQMPEIAALVAGENGLLFKENDLESLTEILTRILDDQRKRRYMSENALRTVEREYNTEVMANRFIQMVTDVAGVKC